jgi:hypothetical protein
MSPVAADCASADNAPGEPAVLGVPEVVVVALAAPGLAEVDGEPLDEDPQPADASADASASVKAQSCLMGGRLAISPDDLLNALRASTCRRPHRRDTCPEACSQRF